MLKRSFVITTLFAASALTAVPGLAQSAAARIAQGDKAYTSLDPASALKLYEAAIGADANNVDALWKASRTAVVLGEFAGTTRDSLYQLAEAYGTRAINLDSTNANAQFALAQALGRTALTHDNPIARLPFARKVYQHATFCLKLNPASAECSHVLGAWNLEAMQVSDMERSMAISMMGAKELSNASWDNAQKYLSAAINAQPKRVIHHLELARVYAAMGSKDKAKAEYAATMKLPATEFNDKNYQAAAKKELDAL